jgi:hypothetical protein
MLGADADALGALASAFHSTYPMIRKPMIGATRCRNTLPLRRRSP